MNYTEIFQLNNIWSDYKVKGSDLYFLTLGSYKRLNKLDLNTLEVKTEPLDDVRSFRFMNDLIIASKNESKTLTLYDFGNACVIQEIQNAYALKSLFIDECKLLYEHYDERLLYIRDVCNNTDELIMPGKFDYFSTLYGDILLSASKAPYRRYIIAYNIKKRVTEWEFDLQEIGKFYSTVGEKWVNGYALNVIVVNDKVYVLTYPKLICLETTTGNILWQVEVNPQTVTIITYLEATNEILLFDSHEFYFINATNGAIVRSSITFYEKAKQLNINIFFATIPVVNDKYLFITFQNAHKLFIIDKYSFEISQIVNLDTCKDSISPSDKLILFEDRIFIRSSDGVMHVFDNK